MNRKGFAPIALVIIVAAVFLLGGGSYLYLKNKNQAPTLIGGQKDSHGCLIAAGYSWCEPKQKCLRIWEEQCVATSTEQIPTTAISTSSQQSTVIESLCSQKPKIGNSVHVKRSTNGAYYVLNYWDTIYDTEGKSFSNQVLDNPNAYYDSSGNLIGYCGGLLNQNVVPFCTKILPSLFFNNINLCL